MYVKCFTAVIRTMVHCHEETGQKHDKIPLNILAVLFLQSNICYLSYDVASGSEITPCIKIDKQLVVYRLLGKVSCMNWRS